MTHSLLPVGQQDSFERPEISRRRGEGRISGSVDVLRVNMRLAKEMALRDVEP